MNAGPRASEAWTEDDSRLRSVVQEYLQELESGRRLDPAAFAARYPEMAEAMAPYLEALDLVHPPLPLEMPEERPAEAALPAEPLGDFRIEAEIGRGGMGIVYEAVQRSLGRRVALKVLPFAAALDARQLQRFRNEAQAAAQLHHPNIVPVYFVGCERGVHFYAMQLIEGQNLAALIASLKAQPAPRGSEEEESRSSVADSADEGNTAVRTRVAALLSTQRSSGGRDYFRSIAGLVAQAATALDYAHGVGIVHRDVKPANLVVDGEGKVWVTDFGLVQLGADAGLTGSGDVLGTLRYMSPEQAGGQRGLMDHRTDVYALGATLYELLTLRPIFDGTDRQMLLRQILHDEPVRPRKLDRAIPPELETIVRKAVAKVPSERYASARELAEDLQRFREDRPITARPPSPAEKLMKWARRHRPLVCAGLASLVLLATVLAITTALVTRAYTRERQKAREADEQRARADANFRQARQAVDLLVQISEEELAGDPRLKRVRWRLLDAVLGYYRDFLQQPPHDPVLATDLEASRAKVKRIVRELITLLEANQYNLLHYRAVQDELRLSEHQRRALARLEGKLHDAFGLLVRREPASWERERLALAREQEAEIARLLTPEQMQRLKQIVRQQRGPRAFEDPDTMAALGLTPEQRKKIRHILERLDGHAPRPGPLPDGTRGEARPATRAARARALRQILESLTPPQRQKWYELTGEALDDEILSAPPPPFAPPAVVRRVRGKRG